MMSECKVVSWSSPHDRCTPAHMTPQMQRGAALKPSHGKCFARGASQCRPHAYQILEVQQLKYCSFQGIVATGLRPACSESA